MNSSRRRVIRIAAGTALVGMRPIDASELISASGWTPSTRSPDSTPVYRWQGLAMGAHVSLDIAHPDQAKAARLARNAHAEMQRLEQEFSLYLETSSLVILNRDGTLPAPSADWLELCSRVSVLWRSTDGRFDPTVQAHWQALVKHADRPLILHEPDTPKGDWRHVRYSPRAISFDRPGMALTLNGVAQGFISERIATLLKSAGCRDVLVNLGEIVAIGQGPNRNSDPKRRRNKGGSGWRVGLADRTDEAPDEILELSDRAISTSTPMATHPGSDVTQGHIIDPRTGKASGAPWRRVSVIHSSATVADGLSTGLCWTPIDRVDAVVAQHPGVRVIGIDARGERREWVG